MMFEHTSVMPHEVQESLALKPGMTVVDCTLGGAGHALAIIKAILPDGHLLGIDQDRDAVEHAGEVLKPFSANVRIVHDNFSTLPFLLNAMGINGVDGILLDLGLSLHQLRQGGRGFSFQKDEPLDMRMDLRTRPTAQEMVNSLDERELADIFFRYGEERMSRKIARAIVAVRNTSPVETTGQLARIVADAIPAGVKRTQKIHPATRVFQALRIAVNRELEQLESFMGAVPDLLNPGARLCVISFHSLEDRIVKQHLKIHAQGCQCPKTFPRCVCGMVPRMKIITRKPLAPGDAEVRQNPMSRSAKLRVAERV
ncbi:MAG: 16S rRNA (cytosine(1402)-N(4))-methyltransferase RsmH [Pseudomonadota bacterium]